MIQIPFSQFFLPPEAAVVVILALAGMCGGNFVLSNPITRCDYDVLLLSHLKTMK